MAGARKQAIKKMLGGRPASQGASRFGKELGRPIMKLQGGSQVQNYGGAVRRKPKRKGGLDFSR